jgi:hypothetical protein
MAYFEVVPWVDPFPGSISTSVPLNIGGTDYYLGDSETYFTASGETWQIGVIASEVVVYLTLAVGNTVTIIIDDANNTTIGGDVFVLGVGAHVLSCPIVGQTADLVQTTIAIPSAAATDTVTNIEVLSATPNLSDFWTDFVKSYEVP